MSTQNLPHLTIDSALKILSAFSCKDSKSVESESEKLLLRQALLLLNDLSDYLNLGICADSADEGFSALESYLKALGYEATINQADSNSFNGSIYIKYNTEKQSYYLDSYTGDYRGVLVSCPSSQDESISGTYGHLPLNLFQPST